MTRRLPVPLLLLASLGLLLGTIAAPDAVRAQTVSTAQVAVDGGAYTNVSATALATMLQAKDFPLVNVHIPYEGELDGTDLFIPFDQIEAHLDQLPADRGARVVLYCRSGHMSDVAARVLVRQGYTDVWNLAGGMIAWEQAGYPLINLAR